MKYSFFTKVKKNVKVKENILTYHKSANNNGIILLMNKDKKDGVYRVYDKFSKFIGIGIIQNNKLKRDVCIWCYIKSINKSQKLSKFAIYFCWLFSNIWYNLIINFSKSLA